MDNLSFSTQNSFLHHGILGQKWGVQNGPPYPLDSGAKSPEERRAKKSIKKAKKALKESKKALRAAKKVYKEIKKSSKVTKDEAMEYLKQKGMLKDGAYYPGVLDAFNSYAKAVEYSEAKSEVRSILSEASTNSTASSNGLSEKAYEALNSTLLEDFLRIFKFE